MYIYKTTNTINGKIYIGLSSKRVEESTSYLGSGIFLHKAIKKYGKEHFTKEILERDITDRNLLSEREIYWIAEYDSTNSKIGYNQLTGGYGGGGTYERTPEIREAARIKSTEVYTEPSADAKERMRQGTIKRNKLSRGKKLSKEHRASIGKAASKFMTGYKYKSLTCPHCGTIGGGGNMTRFHFDNCKHKD